MFKILGTILVLYKIALINVKILLAWSFLKFFKASNSNVKLNDVGKLFDISLYKEFMTFYLIDKVNFYKRILARLTLEKDNGQEMIIDLVIVSEKGIYCFLTSDRKGEIKGNCDSLQWVENHDGKHNKFYNPIWLNETNIDLLSKKLELDKRSFISAIVFNKKSQLKDIKNIAQNVLVTKKEKIKEVIENDYNGRKLIFDKEEVNAIFDELKRFVKLNNKFEKEYFRNFEKK